MSAKELADGMQSEAVTARTVRRDLEVLREIGVPIRTVDRGKYTRYVAFTDGPEVRLDGNNLLALRLALGLMQPYHGTAIGDAIENLGRKLEGLVPRDTYAHFAPLLSSVAVCQTAQPRFGPAEAAFADIREALSRGVQIEIEYVDIDGHESTRTVHPQHLVHGPRGLYLMALDAGKSLAVRTFRLERIRRVVMTMEPLVQRSNIDPEAYSAGSLGVFSAEHEPREFLFRVHSERAVRLLSENPLHTSQGMEARDDGCWYMSLELSSSTELLPHVLAMGSDLEVVEPVGFRQAVIDAVSAASARYSVEKSPVEDVAVDVEVIRRAAPSSRISARSRSPSVPDAG